MKQILVVHTGGGLGDVLLSTAVVRALKQGFPGAAIDFWCRQATSLVLQRNPDLRHLLTLPGKAPRGPGGIWRWSRQLARTGYDAALVLWSVTGIAWTLALAGIPRRVGQDSRLAYSFLYTDRVRVRSEHGDTHSHWSDILLDYVRPLGPVERAAQVVYTVDPAARRRAAALLAELAGEGPVIGFHSGKGMPLEPGRWPVGAFGTWARALEEQLGARLVLTGGPNEVELVEAVAAQGPTRALNLAGRTDLDTLAAVIEQCSVFVCPDSGPMHLAAAVGTPVVGIYALAEDFPRRWAPYCEHRRILRPEPVGCRPGCLKATCPDFRCYHSVTADSVVSAVRELLRERGVIPGN